MPGRERVWGCVKGTWHQIVRCELHKAEPCLPPAEKFDAVNRAGKPFECMASEKSCLPQSDAKRRILDYGGSDWMLCSFSVSSKHPDPGPAHIGTKAMVMVI